MGQLVVATDCCLYGVDPSTGSVQWKRAGLSGLSDHSFETIPGTPLVPSRCGLLPTSSI